MLGLAIMAVLLVGAGASILVYRHTATLHAKVDAVQAAVSAVAVAVKTVK